MCMLSAVVNYPKAAKRLSEMTREQEGLFGGYYSGIGLISDSKVQLSKTKGPISKLQEAHSNACSGIAHSRTKSGGDSGRAQPYMDHYGLMVGMGTGTHGIFAESKASARQALAEELIREGIEFNSKDDEQAGSARLPCGAYIHNTELIVQAVAHRVNKGTKHISAIQEICSETPAEGGYVFLFADKPHELFIANFNMRFLVSQTNGSVILASSHLALSNEESESAAEVPLNCVLSVGPSTKQEQVLSPELESLLDRQAPSSELIDAAVLNYLAEAPNSNWPVMIEKAVLPLFPTNIASALMPSAFQATERLLASGKIRSSLRQLPHKGTSTTPELVLLAN